MNYPDFLKLHITFLLFTYIALVD